MHNYRFYCTNYCTLHGSGNIKAICVVYNHITHVPANASASIGVGQMLAQHDTTMLRAYTTYRITVVAESDVGGSSEDSEPVTVTTAQTSKNRAVESSLHVIELRAYRSSSQCHN